MSRESEQVTHSRVDSLLTQPSTQEITVVGFMECRVKDGIVLKLNGINGLVALGENTHNRFGKYYDGDVEFYIKAPNKMTITDMVVLNNTSFIATLDGKLWVSGENSKGQCHLDHYDDVDNWTELLTDIAYISYPKDHHADRFYVHMQNGDVLAIGGDMRTMLGVGKIGKVKVPTKLAIGDIPANDLEFYFVGNSNSDTFMVRKSTNQVFAWGDNHRGELGLGHNYMVDYPMLVSGIPNKPIKKIMGVKEQGGFSNAASTFILYDDGELWSCGSGELGHLCSGTLSRKTFMLVKSGVKDIFMLGGVNGKVLAWNNDLTLEVWGLQVTLGQITPTEKDATLSDVGMRQIVTKDAGLTQAHDVRVSPTVGDYGTAILHALFKVDGKDRWFAFGDNHSYEAGASVPYGVIVDSAIDCDLMALRDDIVDLRHSTSDNGKTTTLALYTNGEIWGCGYGGRGVMTSNYNHEEFHKHKAFRRVM